jgi:phosphoribosylformylglycinamidine cyclo-ligase
MSTYSDAGVDIDAANRALSMFGPAVAATQDDPRVLNDVGAFGGAFAAAGLGNDPVLVASMDGVGTKVKLAAALDLWDDIGRDLVNHSVNDILVQGARPLFFLDYVATDVLVPETIAKVVEGMAAACREAGCVLLGGETAEMPGVYTTGSLDVAGAIVGVVERDALLPRSDAFTSGDVLVGLPSTGPHTNGYSLIRKLIEGHDLSATLADGRSIGEALLAPHRCYHGEIDALDAAGVAIKGLCHITGGGFPENLPRILPDGLRAVVETSSWETPELFELLVSWGPVAFGEAHRVFNMGIGMIVVVGADQAQAVIDTIGGTVIGSLEVAEAGGAQVELRE